MRIVIIQPVIPHYRVSFFKRLLSALPEISFYASDVDDIGVESVGGNVFPYHKLGNVKRFCGVVWQEKVIAVIKKLKKNDVIVINGNPRYLSTILLLFISKAKGVKVVWWGQGWSSNSTSATFRVRCFFMMLCDRVLLYTEKEILLFDERHRWKLYYLNNGIENQEVRRNVVAYQAELRPPNLLFIGRVTEKANLSFLISALPDIDDMVELHVIGDGVLLNHCKKYAEYLGVLHRVHFYGAMVFEEEIAEVANKCRVFVYPGNVGLSLIHGMNYGLPAVIHSSVARHMPEVFCHEPGNTGEVFEKNNRLDLSRVIDSIVFDVNKLNFYSKRCTSVTERDFNSGSMCNRFLNLVRSL